MWHAMSPPPSGQYQYAGGTHTTSIPNGDGSSTIYVHHMQDAPAPPPPQQPQMQMPQVMAMGIPYPMPTPAPMYAPYPYPPPPPSYGCPYHHQEPQQQQPQIVIMDEESPKDKKDDKSKQEKKTNETKSESSSETKAEDTKSEPVVVNVTQDGQPPDQEHKMSKISIVAMIMFMIALIIGTACIVETYQAYDARMSATENNLPYEEYIDAYTKERALALSLGCATYILFIIATFLSFFAGIRQRDRSRRRRDHCCLGIFLIAAWIIFGLTCINSLIILVIAFNRK